MGKDKLGGAAVLKVGIAGATGYSGAELLRLLSRHPRMEIAWLGADRSAGSSLGDVFPWILDGASNGVGADTTIGEVHSLYDVVDDLDLLFLALPPGTSARLVADIEQSNGPKIVDLGPDFRLSPEAFSVWYGMQHPCPTEIERWAYGFTEGNREAIQNADRVANPGCYAIASLVGLLPLCEENLVEGPVVVDGKSGLSGAGRGAERRLLLAEAFEDVTPYAVEGHRHLPEVASFLDKAVGCKGGHRSMVFVPHLVPMARGLLVSCYVYSRESIDKSEVLELFERRYASEPFITVCSSPPHTKAVRGTNLAAVYPTVQRLTAVKTGGGYKGAFGSKGDGGSWVVVTVAIDNLGKGAAGSAVQNANLMFGLDEREGLEGAALWP